MVSKEFDQPKAQKACNMCPLTCRKVKNKWNIYIKEIFLMIINDPPRGSIQLFAMINYEISANSQH